MTNILKLLTGFMAATVFGTFGVVQLAESFVAIRDGGEATDPAVWIVGAIGVGCIAAGAFLLSWAMPK